MRINLLSIALAFNFIGAAQVSQKKIESYLNAAYIEKGRNAKTAINAPDDVFIDSNEIKVLSDTLLSVKLFVQVNYVKDTLGGELY
ncbi:hypothetical protein SAMN05216474_1373 [Lishizhenia tianjinensis]|uniref:Uncharacterized protein n=1 Tax=Lishizhenia tianjinensis TaxID=477690 RepID=A0A1I6ZHW8_9FLAO|nr:hypothetical protein [Lishizhenia tianjinensis]SFT62263.1 hypothetical protein SAMN05216474_1373 [Lishizhenia tianjinensis]